MLASSLVPVVPAVAEETDSGADEALFAGSISDGLNDAEEGVAGSIDLADADNGAAVNESPSSDEASFSGKIAASGLGNEVTNPPSESSQCVEAASSKDSVVTQSATSTSDNTFTNEYGTWKISVLKAGGIKVTPPTIITDTVLDVFELPSVVPCDVKLSNGDIVAEGTPIVQYGLFSSKMLVKAKEVVFSGNIKYGAGTSFIAECETVTFKDGATCPNLDLTGVKTLNVGSGAQVPRVQNSPTLKKLNISADADFSRASFKGCSALEATGTLSSVNESMFENCTSLKSVELQDSVTKISGSAFRGCTSLKSVELKGNVAEIESNAFRGCSELSSIDLTNIVSIGSYAFEGTKLSNISIPTGCSVSGSAFRNNTASPTVYYDGKSLGGNSFNGTSIKSLSLGPNASDIKPAAFNQAKIGHIYISPENTLLYTTTGENLFARTDGESKQLYPFQPPAPQVPDTIRSVPASSTEFNVGKDIKNILSGTFNSHPRIASISIEEGNTSFVLDSQGALYTADMKTLLKVPADVTSFVVPDSVTMIEQNAFCRCDKLTSVTLPESLVEIKTEAFWGCSSLASIKFPKSLTTIGVGILEGTALEKLQMSEGLWSNSTKDDFVQDGAVPSISTLFYGMNWNASNWNTDLLNKSVTSLDLGLYKPSFIPAYAFAGLLGLTEVSIPSSVTNIGYGAFYFCLNLKDVYVYAPTGMKIETGGMSDGNSGSGNADESYKVSNPSSFSTWDESLDPAPFTSAKYADLTGINFYGAAYSQNDVISYCAKNGQNFIPIAVLQDNSTVFGNYTVTYGTGAYDYNHVEIANIPVGGTPSVNVVFGDYGTPRTLTNGNGCSVYYVDSEGNVVTSFDKAGTYTAFISGDNKSVFGQRAVSFQVGDAAQPVQPDQPVQPAQPTQPTQPVSTVPVQQQPAAAAGGQTLATTGDTTDVAPVAAVGFAGALAAVGAWFARRRLKDEQ